MPFLSAAYLGIEFATRCVKLVPSHDNFADSKSYRVFVLLTVIFLVVGHRFSVLVSVPFSSA